MTAIFYDSLLLLALLMLATALWLPFTDGEAIQGYDWLYRGYLLLVSFGFFGGFWLRGGQTLGLRAWRLRLRSLDGGPVSLRQALIRFLVAPLSWAVFGLGFLHSIIDPRGRTWHDLAAGTELVLEPKPAERSPV
ncbi:RDD family protein [Alkalilimnicola sp. S0819]|nr:RDD family protein [Alkalilimnicola sp. S0819]MPQ15240.1 RDD family protein [Alkalilimnicola sp. S0819]